MKRTVGLCALIMTSLLPVLGCANRSVTRTEIVREDSDVRGRYVEPDDEVKIETRTTTVEDDNDPDRGFFGIVGNIIALPFRAVGGLLSAIF